MKKLLSFLCALMISVFTYADSTTCPVANSNGATASLENTSGTSGKLGPISITVCISGEHKNTNVLVNIYDADTNSKVGTLVINVPWNQDCNSGTKNGLAPEHNYYFKIHNASCR